MIDGNIPIEILILILNKLNYPTCIFLASTCRSLYNIIHSDGFWKHKTIANFGGVYPSAYETEPYQQQYLRIATYYYSQIYPGAEEYTPLYNIAQRYCDISIKYTTYFLDRFSIREFYAALISVSETGDINTVEYLLDKLNRDYNWTPSFCDYAWSIAHAARNGHIDMVRFILKMLTDKIQEISTLDPSYEMNVLYTFTNHPFTPTPVTAIRQGIRWAAGKGYMDIVFMLNDYTN